MNVHLKLLAGAATGLLLGFGLCGVANLSPSSRSQELGGSLAFIGLAVCLISVLLLLGTLLSFAVTVIIKHFRARP